MQKTTNYKLPKWEKADRILMDDFNGLTGTLDTALHGVAVSAEAAQAAADSEATARANAVTAEATARENADAALRTAVDGKQAKLTGAATTIAASNLTASRALVSNASGKVAVSAVTAAELGYLDGVTSAVQTQLNGKAASSHTHAQSSVTGLTAALAAKGNCRIQAGSYTGTGTSGESSKNTIACSGVPLLLCVLAATGEGILLAAGNVAKGQLLRGGSNYTMNMTWNSGSVQWYFSGNHTDTIGYQLNNTGWVYHYVLLYQAD